MLFTDSSAPTCVQDDKLKLGLVDLIAFFKALFAYTTTGVYICSFPNERGDPNQAGERHVITRKPSKIASFLNKWDKLGRGTFFCVAALQESAHKRNKDNVAQIVCLHADIDFKNIDLLGADPLSDVLRHIARLRIQPSIIVSSGGGVHLYWLLTEPLDAQGNIERIEAVLRQIADVVAGDLAVCEVSRVMRIPGSHNTKNGGWKEVEIKDFHPERQYEFDDIEEWLGEQSPVMLRRDRKYAMTAGEYFVTTQHPTDGEIDVFAEYGKLVGSNSRLNAEQRLLDMMYMAGGDNSIHATQLSVTASLLNAGVKLEEVVERVFVATQAAAGEYGARWNWQREHRKIVGMCVSWLNKRAKRDAETRHPQVIDSSRERFNEVRP